MNWKWWLRPNRHISCSLIEVALDPMPQIAAEVWYFLTNKNNLTDLFGIHDYFSLSSPIRVGPLPTIYQLSFLRCALQNQNIRKIPPDPLQWGNRKQNYGNFRFIILRYITKPCFDCENHDYHFIQVQWFFKAISAYYRCRWEVHSSRCLAAIDLACGLKKVYVMFNIWEMRTSVARLAANKYWGQGSAWHFHYDIGVIRWTTCTPPLMTFFK